MRSRPRYRGACDVVSPCAGDTSGDRERDGAWVEAALDVNQIELDDRMARRDDGTGNRQSRTNKGRGLIHHERPAEAFGAHRIEDRIPRPLDANVHRLWVCEWGRRIVSQVGIDPRHAGRIVSQNRRSGRGAACAARDGDDYRRIDRAVRIIYLHRKVFCVNTSRPRLGQWPENGRRRAARHHVKSAAVGREVVRAQIGRVLGVNADVDAVSAAIGRRGDERSGRDGEAAAAGAYSGIAPVVSQCVVDSYHESRRVHAGEIIPKLEADRRSRREDRIAADRHDPAGTEVLRHRWLQIDPERPRKRCPERVSECIVRRDKLDVDELAVKPCEPRGDRAEGQRRFRRCLDERNYRVVNEIRVSLDDHHDRCRVDADVVVGERDADALVEARGDLAGLRRNDGGLWPQKMDLEPPAELADVRAAVVRQVAGREAGIDRVPIAPDKPRHCWIEAEKVRCRVEAHAGAIRRNNYAIVNREGEAINIEAGEAVEDVDRERREAVGQKLAGEGRFAPENRRCQVHKPMPAILSAHRVAEAVGRRDDAELDRVAVVPIPRTCAWRKAKRIIIIVDLYVRFDGEAVAIDRNHDAVWDDAVGVGQRRDGELLGGIARDPRERRILNPLRHRPREADDEAPAELALVRPAIIRLIFGINTYYNGIAIRESDSEDRGVEVELAGRIVPEDAGTDAVTVWCSAVYGNRAYQIESRDAADAIEEEDRYARRNVRHHCVWRRKRVPEGRRREVGVKIPAQRQSGGWRREDVVARIEANRYRVCIFPISGVGIEPENARVGEPFQFVVEAGISFRWR